MADEPSIVSNLQAIFTSAATVATAVVGYLAYKKNNEVKQLEAKVEYLKQTVHKVSAKVDPESDRQIIMGAQRSIQLMGINSLGPIHHCREEIIQFLRSPEKKMYVLLLDPESDEFGQRMIFEHDNSQRLRREWHASLAILNDIQEKSSGSIEIRLRSALPNRSLLIIDSKDRHDEHSKMLINYYPDQESMRGYAGVQFLAEFSMERDRDSFFKNLTYFRQRWDEARPVKLHEIVTREEDPE